MLHIRLMPQFDKCDAFATMKMLQNVHRDMHGRLYIDRMT